MVTRVYGFINDVNVVLDFIHTHGDVWQISNIPKNMRGQYYLEIYAEDDAGNVSFITKAVFEVDPFSLEVNLNILDKDFTSKIKDFDNKSKTNDYNAVIKVNDFISNIRDSDFNFVCKEVICI